MQFKAVEKASEIRAALKMWEHKFSIGAVTISEAKQNTWWNRRIATSARFRIADAQAGSGHWIAFGRTRTKFRQNLIVEINPPVAGIPAGVQGIIGTASNGDRWILHHGRLHPRNVRITEDLFDAVYPWGRVDVHFSNGTVSRYHPVANIDDSATALQDSIAGFVGQCYRVRAFYTDGKEEAEMEGRIEEAEESSPESAESYVVGVQNAKIVERKHGKVWQALADFLDNRKIQHTNSRVGRWGPDLRTKESPRVLFEIKTDIEASDIQRGFGQLLLYEKLLKKPHKKVLLLPRSPAPTIERYLAGFGITIAYFKWSKGKVVFPHDFLE